jgi:hypothetical protein
LRYCKPAARSGRKACRVLRNHLGLRLCLGRSMWGGRREVDGSRSSGIQVETSKNPFRHQLRSNLFKGLVHAGIGVGEVFGGLQVSPCGQRQPRPARNPAQSLSRTGLSGRVDLLAWSRGVALPYFAWRLAFWLASHPRTSTVNRRASSAGVEEIVGDLVRHLCGVVGAGAVRCSANQR